MAAVIYICMTVVVASLCAYGAVEVVVMCMTEKDERAAKKEKEYEEKLDELLYLIKSDKYYDHKKSHLGAVTPK